MWVNKFMVNLVVSTYRTEDLSGEILFWAEDGAIGGRSNVNRLAKHCRDSAGKQRDSSEELHP